MKIKCEIKCEGSTCPDRYDCALSVATKDTDVNILDAKFDKKCEFFKKKGETV